MTKFNTGHCKYDKAFIFLLEHTNTRTCDSEKSSKDDECVENSISKFSINLFMR